VHVIHVLLLRFLCLMETFLKMQDKGLVKGTQQGGEIS